MARALRRWIEGTSPSLLWVDLDDYAHRVFAGGAAGWLDDVARRVTALAQARQVVGSQVVTVDGWVMAQGLAGREAFDGGVAAIVERLTAVALRERLGAFIDALVHRMPREVDVVLRLPSPAVLVGGASPSFDDLDDVGAALTGLARAVSDRAIDALVLEASASELDDDDAVEAVEPVLGAARHFGWLTAIAAPPGSWPRVARWREVFATDLYAFDDAPLVELVQGADRRVVGGLGAAWWSVPADTAGADAGLFGSVPATATPEEVVERFAALRGGIRP